MDAGAPLYLRRFLYCALNLLPPIARSGQRAICALFALAIAVPAFGSDRQVLRYQHTAVLYESGRETLVVYPITGQAGPLIIPVPTEVESVRSIPASEKPWLLGVRDYPQNHSLAPIVDLALIIGLFFCLLLLVEANRARAARMFWVAAGLWAMLLLNIIGSISCPKPWIDPAGRELSERNRVPAASFQVLSATEFARGRSVLGYQSYVDSGSNFVIAYPGKLATGEVMEPVAVQFKAATPWIPVLSVPRGECLGLRVKFDSSQSVEADGYVTREHYMPGVEWGQRVDYPAEVELHSTSILGEVSRIKMGAPIHMKLRPWGERRSDSRWVTAHALDLDRIDSAVSVVGALSVVLFLLAVKTKMRRRKIAGMLILALALGLLNAAMFDAQIERQIEPGLFVQRSI